MAVVASSSFPVGVGAFTSGGGGETQGESGEGKDQPESVGAVLILHLRSFREAPPHAQGGVGAVVAACAVPMEEIALTQPAPCPVVQTPIRLDPAQRNPQLVRFRELMERMVVGQPGALETVTNSFSRLLAGIHDPESPILTMMLLGPTGVGKTETVRCLAQALFGSRRAFTRVNCQEYSAHYNLSKLLGSPPGYVGGEIKP